MQTADSVTENSCISPKQCLICGTPSANYFEGFCSICIMEQERAFRVSEFHLTQEERLQRDLSEFQYKRERERELRITNDPRNREYLLKKETQKRIRHSIENLQAAHLWGGKSLIILTKTWLDIFHRGLVRACVVCKDPCRHLTGEDCEFLLFWKMRLVSKQWREIIDSWFETRRFILVTGRIWWNQSEQCLNHRYLINKYHNAKRPYLRSNSKELITRACSEKVLQCVCSSQIWMNFVRRVSEIHHFITFV